MRRLQIGWLMKAPSNDTAEDSPGNTERLDKIGGFVSTACAIHCLISPLLFLSLPAFAKIWAHPATHAIMAVGVVPMALTVVIYGYRKHLQKWVSAAALCGIALILVGSALPYVPSSPESVSEDPLAVAAKAEESCDCCPSIITEKDGETKLLWPPAGIATVAGSGFLILAHWGNRRCSRRCCENATGTCQKRA